MMDAPQSHTSPLLESICEHAASYPSNLPRQYGRPSVLEAEEERLREQETLLFRSAKVQIRMMEKQEAHNELPTYPDLTATHNDSSLGLPANCSPHHGIYVENLDFQDFDSLKEHLSYPMSQGLEDVAYRHVFIRGNNNQSALWCTPMAFKYICSYHQISPGFLKLVHQLGNQLKHDKPRSSHFGGFFNEIHDEPSPNNGSERRSSDISTVSDSPNVAERHDTSGSTRLGRSGRQLRNYYQLSGMERSAGGPSKWSMRQSTVYHSFDLVSAKQLWITIKAEANLEQRFQEEHSASTSGEPFERKGLQRLDRAFESSLRAHIVHLEWCVEGWKWYLNDREVEIRHIMERSEAAPVTHGEPRNAISREATFGQVQGDIPHAGLGRLNSIFSRPSRQVTLNREDSSPTVQRFNTLTSGISRKSTVNNGKGVIISQRPQPVSIEAAVAQIQMADHVEHFRHTEGIFKDFTIKGYQKLSAFSTGLQDTKLALESNLRALEGIRESYGSFTKSDECPVEIKDSCQRAVRNFGRVIDGLQRELQSEIARVNSLAGQLQDAKPLYESILQYRNTKAHETMALHARYASLRMESVGERTEKLTSSMHVITTFTLLLLPGTFLGVGRAICTISTRRSDMFLAQSIFSTDIIKRGDAGIHLDSVLGILFLEICLPMMICSLFAWGLYMFLKRRAIGNRSIEFLQHESARYDAEKGQETV